MCIRDRATHNSFMMRLLPMINQAVAAAIASGQHKDQLAEDTRKDHALLMDFFRKRDAAGAGHAMAIHMHHSIDVMGLGTQCSPSNPLGNPYGKAAPESGAAFSLYSVKNI